MIAFCDSLETAQEKGYFCNAFVETDLILNKGFPEFQGTLESNTRRYIIDTGCTTNILHSNEEALFAFVSDPSQPPPFLSFNPSKMKSYDSFTVEGKSLGEISFFETQLPENIQGIIGMEFLENTIVFIDFLKKKVYFENIDPSPVNIGEEKE
ncbi:MAG: hypothetical protein RLZZ453_137 [Chlamydiota bacterium]|jgi:hypothetical protein